MNAEHLTNESHQRGIEKKERQARQLRSEDNLLVRRSYPIKSPRGRDLLQAWLASATTTYLLVTTLDSWVMTGSNESKILSQEQAKALDIVRLYEKTNLEFWDKVATDIQMGKIWAGGLVC